MASDPVRVQSLARALKLQKHRAQKLEMVVELQLAIVRNLADLPEQADAASIPRVGHHLAVLPQPRQRVRVFGLVLKFQASGKGSLAQRRREGVHRAGVEIVAAPEDARLHRETMVFDGVADRSRQWRQWRQRGEATIVVVPSSPPCDLRQLGFVQLACLPAVELAQLGKRHAIHVHIEAHPDRVRRHQIVDFTSLVKSHLRVARPR